jgi:hypothetical protein
MSNLCLQSMTSNVAALNNQAVAQIHNGEYVSAISSLSLVFNVCKGLLSSCRVSCQQKGDKNGDYRALVPTSYYTFSSEVEQCRVSTSQEDDGADSLFFCRRPLELVDPSAATRTIRRYHLLHEENPEAVTDFAEFATYAIIYNLALCHHLQADMSSAHGSFLNVTGRSKSLKRAVVLYSYARDALNLVLESPMYPASSIHLVVLLNNMVHASQMLGDEESARRCLHSLAKTATSLLVQRRKRSSSEPNETDEFARIGIVLDRIIMNIALVLFGKRGCFTAPAA